MTRFLTFIVALAAAFSAQAANLFVTPAGAGSGNGNNWNTAIAGIQAATALASSGDTIWFAGGTYGATVIQKAGLTIKRATAADAICTSAPGWNPAFDAQAVMTSTAAHVLEIQQDNTTIDGRTWNGLSIFGQHPVDQVSQYACIYALANNVTLRNIEAYVTPNNDVWYASLQFGSSAAGFKSGLTVQYCYFHGGTQGIFETFSIGTLVEHSEIYNISYGAAPTTVGLHQNPYYLSDTRNTTFRYNKMHRAAPTGFYVTPFGSGTDGLYIYSNQFYDCPGDFATGITFDPNYFPIGPNVFIYGNTFAVGGAAIRTTQRFTAQPVSGGSIANNIFFGCSVNTGNCPIARDYDWFTSSDIWSASEAHSVVGNGANPFVNSAAFDYHLLSTVASNFPRNKGVALPAPYNVDFDGNLRGVDGAWDIGAFEYGGAPPVDHGTLVLDSATYSATEGNSVSLIVRRTGGTVGAIGVNYATADGTAAAGVNYTSTSGVLSWADGNAADKTITVPTINAGFAGSKAFTLSISGASGGAAIGSPSTGTITLNGTGTSLLPGLSWQAEAGTLTAPWSIATNGGVVYIYSTNQTLVPSTPGIASYQFLVSTSGVYRLKAALSAATDGNNSVRLDFNNPAPSEPGAVWDTPITGAGVWTNVYASWRGTGTFDVAQYPGKTWQLNAGTNTLYVLTREADTRFDTFTVEQFTAPVVQVAINGVQSVLGPNGYFAAGSNMLITVQFSTNAFVNSGTPSLALNNGRSASYVSGSGSTNLVLSYTPIVGDDTQLLSYVATNSLSGDIRDGGGTAFDLTLPTPGTVGSMSFNSAAVVDTVPPAISAGPPTVPIVFDGMGQTSWAITYSDLNFSRVTLIPANITLSLSGTANATNVAVAHYGQVAVVMVAGFQGTGTIQPVIAAGTGVDLAGNLAGSLTLAPVSVLPYKLKMNNVKLYNVLFP